MDGITPGTLRGPCDSKARAPHPESLCRHSKTRRDLTGRFGHNKHQLGWRRSLRRFLRSQPILPLAPAPGPPYPSHTGQSPLSYRSVNSSRTGFARRFRCSRRKSLARPLSIHTTVIAFLTRPERSVRPQARPDLRFAPSSHVFPQTQRRGLGTAAGP
jgi:hypothetical protein